MQHSEFFQLFTAYWWLIFVLIWIVARLARVWSRHVQAQRTLDMIKSYVDQGKEPPPENAENPAIGFGLARGGLAGTA